MTPGTALFKWAFRILAPVSVVSFAVIGMGTALGAHVPGWMIALWAGVMALTYGITIPALARAARGWEQTAQGWKESALEYGKMLDEAQAVAVRLLTADRGDQP